VTAGAATRDASVSSSTLIAPQVRDDLASAARARGWILFNLVALLAVAIALRIWRLGNIPGVNGDEAWTAVQALRWMDGGEVAWRTPNGNPLNPFYLLPALVLHTVFAPSFVVLRLTALFSGILALAANYFLCRRAFDPRTAVLSTWILALLPIDIAYSRFAWDTSQSLLFTVLVLYLPLLSRKAAGPANFSGRGALALAAAILVHPTNVFAAPLLIAPPLVEHRLQLRWWWRTTRVSPGGVQLAVLASAGVAATYFAWKLIEIGGERLHGPAVLGPFARYYLQFFSGTTVYAFITGATLPATDGGWPALALACDTLCLVFLAGAVWGLVRRFQSGASTSDVCVAVGYLVMLLGFFVVAGPEALAPHAERYGICLVAPTVLLASRGWGWWFERQSRPAVAALWAMAWCWAISFYLGYFVYVEQTGGNSHATFRTATIEPKVQAIELIEAHRQPGAGVTLVCQEFWNYWPLAYLAHGRSDWRVCTWDEWREGTPLATGGQTWFVEYAGSAAEARVLSLAEAESLTITRLVVCDYAGRPLLSLVGESENLFQNY